MRLAHRLILAFVLVAAVAVGVSAVLVGLSTAGRFERYSQEVRLATLPALADELGRAYQRTGDLADAAEELLPGRAGLPAVLVISDQQGDVVWGEGAGRMGPQGIPPGWPSYPIVVAGETVGSIHASGSRFWVAPSVETLRGGMADPLEQRFIDETSRSLLIGFAVAVAVALVLGLILARGITGPLRRLAEATQALAARRRGVRSGIRSPDEIGALSRAFDGMADSLDAQEEARRNLFADVAHELRTPLTVVEGNLQAILDGVYDRSDENLEAVLERARGLHRLVEDLRDLSLAEVGQLGLEITDVDLARLLERVTREMEPRAQSRRLSLSTRADQAGTVRADPARLRQVLVNLIDNAIRHTPQGGALRIQAGHAADGRATVEVEDTGEGIAPEDLPHVFDRFYRADVSRARASGGTGLGLAIVRALVEAMGGTAGVESEVGQGSRFRIELPVAAAEPHQAEGPTGPEPQV